MVDLINSGEAWAAIRAKINAIGTAAGDIAVNAAAAEAAALAADGSADAASASAGVADTARVNAMAARDAAIGARDAAVTAKDLAVSAGNAAAASYDAFDDRFLGAKAADPTTDNDGAALLTGALYWNTASGAMRVWNGSAWVTAFVPSTDYLSKAGNLSGLADAAAARTNLGLDGAVTVTDWNSITKTGSYYGDAAATNRPANFAFLATASFLDSNNGILFACMVSGTAVYVRRKSGGVWGNWTYYSSTSELAKFSEPQVDDGTKSSGTYTPSISASGWGHWRKIANGGAFALAAPTDSGSFSMVVTITNGATAGAITMTGFAKVSGNSFTTTNGHKFRVYITKDDAGVTAFIEALQ